MSAASRPYCRTDGDKPPRDGAVAALSVFRASARCGPIAETLACCRASGAKARACSRTAGARSRQARQ